MHRDNVDLDHGTITIDPHTGTLHESGHSRWLGAPKTASSARVITLPPFLIGLLRQHLQRHDHEFIFTTKTGKWWWRSTFLRRVLQPAVNGNENNPQQRVRDCPH
ncbi:hypothetical protein DMH04_34400 [Kibdelosporangium aridum]|uniref:Tyr recombinase domain-containing protein n=1 Tax=Kibdelosporangium aridum TaxID=2030 RepID=A0A428Z0R5_KIBAR|nr:hypothetical protein DMH04_34400 [Kibdelosporangium aridum]